MSRSSGWHGRTSSSGDHDCILAPTRLSQSARCHTVNYEEPPPELECAVGVDVRVRGGQAKEVPDHVCKEKYGQVS